MRLCHYPDCKCLASEFCALISYRQADTIHDATFAQGLKEGNSNIILAAHEFYMHNYPTYYVDSHVPSIQNRKDIKEHR